MYELEMNETVPENLKENTHDMMKRVIEIAPYSSTCRGLVVQTEEGFKIQVEVRSAVGILSGLGESPQYSEALKEAERGVGKEIDQWRKLRFRDQGLDRFASAL